MKLSSVLSLALLGSLVLMTGCVSRTVVPKNSGFLKTYEGLDTKNAKFEKSMIRISPEVDFASYENIYVAPVNVISGVSKENMTDKQRKLYAKIAEYVRIAYKKEIKDNGIYTLAENKETDKTLVLEIGLSAVEVHFDDVTWYQLSPIELGLTGTSISTYLDGAVRILGESRLIDISTGKVLLRTMRLQKTEKVSLETKELNFTDLKPALDAWLQGSTKNLARIRENLIKYEEKK
ncbi:MAG: hypothetical protein COA44_05000 [Arcobacter sp.]|nr:MAG: hypothetical protein COA44_05000 [Arcobacter sp.]